jgi:hypothetical protein
MSCYALAVNYCINCTNLALAVKSLVNGPKYSYSQLCSSPYAHLMGSVGRSNLLCRAVHSPVTTCRRVGGSVRTLGGPGTVRRFRPQTDAAIV